MYNICLLFFCHLVQRVQCLFSGNESWFGFLEVGGAVGLFDGDLNVDLVHLDLLLVRARLLLCHLLGLDPHNLDQLIGLR